MRSPSVAGPLLLGALFAAGYAAVGLYYLDGELGWPLDDSWIHLAFARNLARGEGLALNPGELVPGSTAPLWTALVSLAFLFPGPAGPWVALAGCALFLATVWASALLARELGLGAGLATLAAALVAATGWLVWSALSGLEIPLFAAASTLGLALAARERRRRDAPGVAFFVLGVAALARPEGLVLLAVAALDRLLVWERGADGRLGLGRPAVAAVGRGLAVAALLVVPIAVWNLAVSGAALPTTFGAKSAGVASLTPSLAYLYAVLGIFFRAQPLLTLTAVAGSLVLLERLGGERDRGAAPALWLLALPLAYSLLSSPGRAPLVGNFGRYYFPLFPVLLVLGVLGLERAARAVGAWQRLGRLQLPLGAAVLALLLWPTARALVTTAGRYAQSVGNVHDSNVAMARYLEPRLDPEAILAVNDIGAFGYLLPQRLVDLAGIATPEVKAHLASARRRGDDESAALFDFLAARRPDYLVIFPEWLPGLVARGDFAPVHEIAIRSNITMGSDRLVLFATPWTRHPLHEPRP